MNHTLYNPDLAKDIEEIEQLHKAYEDAVSRSSSRNKPRSVNAYLTWYNKLVAICTSAFGTDDKDVQRLLKTAFNGNGNVAYAQFNNLTGTYTALLTRLKELSTLKPTTEMVEELESETTGNTKPLIFISHAGDDKMIIRLFINYILKNGLGLRDENIVCTSFEETTLQSGEDIPTYIKNNIENASLVLAMVSQNYKKSEVCLNEVGAAWALDKKPLQIVLPDADYDSLGWLLNTRKANRIDDQESLDGLEASICAKLGIDTPKPLNWNPFVREFLKALASLNANTIAPSEVEAPCVKLTFEDGSQHQDVMLPIGVIYYSNPVKKLNHRELYNQVVYGGSGIAAAEQAYDAMPVRVKAVVSSGEVNRSMIPLNLVLQNSGPCLEDVSIVIKGANVTFADDNETHPLAVASFEPNLRFGDNKCTIRMGDCNAEVPYTLKKLYVEFQDLYREYGVYEFAENMKSTLELEYMISTKQKPYFGKLSFNIGIEPHCKSVEKEEKAGCATTYAFKESL